MGKKIFIAIVFVLLLAGVYINHFLHVGIPHHSGEVRVSGLEGEVEILRDDSGIPHIFASSETDAYFALGYAMSQDRLFQMEFLRAAGNGSLSEILGESMVGADKFLKKIMLRPKDPAAIADELPQSVQAMLSHFIDGINSYLISDPDLPIEFRLLGHVPAAWDVGDILAIAKLQSWQLSYNYDSELIYRQLNEKLGAERTAELFPYYAPEHIKIMDEFGGNAQGDMALLSQSKQLRELLGTNGGSNNWVVSGERTTSGKPMLCSDPHLHGSSLPGPWYFAQLNAPGLDVAGGFFPGLPACLIGHNRNIAWGLTNMGPDVQDLFIEEVNPDDPYQYLYQEQWLDFEIIPEALRIKDDDAENGFRYEEFEIRKSIHGPLIKDEDEVLALAWTGHHFFGEIEALYRVNHASDWGEFTVALSHFSTAPQNFVYADVEGNIGYYGAGKVPIRKSGSGLFPVPGHTGEYDWSGYIPFEDLPHLYNPDGGMIVTANAEPHGADYPYPMPGEYAPEFRTKRIRDLIKSKEKLTAADMGRIQQDQQSYLVPLVLEHLLPVIPQEHVGVKTALSNWDQVLDADGFEGSIYRQTLDTFLRLILTDDLGPELAEEYLSTWYIATNRWLLMMEDNENPWFDKVDTDKVETRDDLMLEAFTAAMSHLEETFETSDFTSWKWGEIHDIVFHHVFEAQGGIIEKFFNYGPFPIGGDGETVNRATHVFTKPYQAEMTASMRMIADMSDASRSLMANASGQVGMPLQEHYTDLIDGWLAGEYVEMHLDRDELGAINELILAPK
ncbi:MAG: penicillin acylase family protein [Candidatus Marinimicrobia bacterium]|nr:penicillin acylase family protein [Candidatus Neomarinimicrobiota bacterium]MCF7850306.1 penicillin acylase family protein [Candidatus Neomarinimicrobiota bacterium]MCF7903898.1 penicillin acylase family protein [Candidatus Neomarinimicrobiota bacterium]